MKKQIIIMAKSVKHYPHYCIAGIDLDTHKWIRPISSNTITEGAVPREHIIYENGREVEVLDVVEIEFTNPAETKAQQENYAYNEDIPWRKVGEMSLEELLDNYEVDTPEFVFENTEKSLDNWDITGTSLLLLEIDNPCVVVKTFPNRKKVNLNFTYNNRDYNYIQVGDRNLYNQFINSNDGYYKLGSKMFAVFSLTGEYTDGRYYKMLAQLF